LTPPAATRFWSHRSWTASREAPSLAGMASRRSFTPPCGIGCPSYRVHRASSLPLAVVVAAEALVATSAADAAELPLHAVEMLRPGQVVVVELGGPARARRARAPRSFATAVAGDRRTRSTRLRQRVATVGRGSGRRRTDTQVKRRRGGDTGLCVKHFRLVSSRRTLRGGLTYDRIALVDGCGGAGGRTWARLRRTQCTQTRGCEKGSGHGRLVSTRSRAGAATCPVSDAFGDCGNLEVR
jgi:hypothetical protein